MTSIGETLRRERLRRGLDLRAVSNELKISLKFLEAIEAEDFDKLPGGMFTRSFVRQYARYLGLDEEDMVAELDGVLEPATPPVGGKAASDFEVPRVEEWQVMNDRFSWTSSLPALALVVVVMLVCSFVYSWWQRSRTSANAAPHTVVATETARASPPAQPPAPEPAQSETAQQEPPPAASPASGPVSAQTPAAAQPPAAVRAPDMAPAPQQRHDVGSADRPAPESSAPAAAPTAPNGGLPAPQTGAPAATPQPAGPVHVELTATEPVWVLAQTDGKYSFSGTLEANQTRTVEANGRIVLRLGNAGGVNISLNGKPIGAVGAKGQVKTIQLTSGGWTAAAPKPSLPVEDIL